MANVLDLSIEKQKELLALKQQYASATTEADRQRISGLGDTLRADAGIQAGSEGQLSASQLQSAIASRAPAPIVPTGPTTSELSSQLAQKQQQAQIAALAKARNASMAALNQEQTEIAPAFAGARSQTRATSQRGAQQFSEFMANRGLSSAGGAALGETRRQGAVQGALGGLREQETSALGDIASRRSGISSAFATDVASAQAGIQADELSRQIALAQSQEASQTAARQQEFENAIKMAGVTGLYDGQQTLLGQQAADNATAVQQDLELGRIGLQEAQLRLQQLQNPVLTGGSTGGGGAGEIDPATGVTYDVLNKAANLYKTNPGLAQAYVMSLNLPNYQFNALNEALGVAETPTPGNDLTPYQQFINSQGMDSVEAGQYISSLLSRGAITRPEAEQMNALFNVAATQTTPTPVAQTSVPTKESLYARYASNEITEQEYIALLNQYEY